MEEFKVVTRRRANNRGMPLAMKKPDVQVENETARLIRFMFSYNPKGKRKPVCINGRQSPPWAYASDAFPSNLIEFVYHPDVYKTRMCPDGEKCREPREKCGYLHQHEVFLPPWRCQGLVVDGYWYPPDPVSYEWFRYLMLDFKTGEQPCRIKREHDIQRCPNWHSQADPSDRRQPVLLNRDTGRWVPLPNNSPLTAVRFHPMSYKRQACIFIEGQREKCIRGRYCTHSHLGDEIVLIPRYLERLKQELLNPMGNPLSKEMPLAGTCVPDSYPSTPLSSLSSAVQSPPLSPRPQALPSAPVSPGQQALPRAANPIGADTDRESVLETTAKTNELKSKRAWTLSTSAEPSPSGKKCLGGEKQADEVNSVAQHEAAGGQDKHDDTAYQECQEVVKTQTSDSATPAIAAAELKDLGFPATSAATAGPMTSHNFMSSDMDSACDVEDLDLGSPATAMQKRQVDASESIFSGWPHLDQSFEGPVDMSQSHVVNQLADHCYGYGTGDCSGQVRGQWWTDYDSQSMFATPPVQAVKTAVVPGQTHGGADITATGEYQMGYHDTPWSAFTSPVWTLSTPPQLNRGPCLSAPLSIAKYQSWSADDVMRWALGHDDPIIQSAAHILRNNDIDGSLLMYLDDHSLRDMGMLSFGMRVKIMAAISKVAGVMR